MDNNRFEEIYNKLKQNGFADLEAKRKKAHKSKKRGRIHENLLILAVSLIGLLAIPVIIISIILLVIEGASPPQEIEVAIKYMFLVFGISLLVLLYDWFFIKKAKNNKNKYKMGYMLEFNKAFIKEINPNYSYDGRVGVLEKNYIMVDLFPYEDYQARGLISGKMSNGYDFRAGQVTTWSSYQDSNNTTIKFIKFDGLFYEIDLPFSINSRLYLRSDKKLDNANFIKKLLNADGKLSRLKMNMESEEFENIFDVYADNRILALQIFTADVMLELMDLYSSTSNKFEITIDKDKLYIKFNTGAIFKPPEDLTIEVLNKDILCTYFNKFESALKLSEKLIKTIIEENNIL